jgi:non-ribosomal peptide synthetase component F
MLIILIERMTVPLCFSKSTWNVVSMLAVLKAGDSFVPLDPFAPTERLKKLAGNVGATIILCSPQHASLLASVTGSVISVDRDMLSLLPQPGELPLVSSSDLAYLIYTSGSTGEPKGTMISHGVSLLFYSLS